jgi:anti-sigma regulatory factor (Ser/Thr protein kinase)
MLHLVWSEPTIDSSLVDHSVPCRAEITLDEGVDSVGIARDFAAKLLTTWPYQGPHDDVILVVSELVTNAVLHGGGAPVLRLTATEQRLRIEVTDNSSVLPALRPSGANGGWGLRLVGRLGVSWGTTRRGTGKVVWCELEDASEEASAATG